MSQRPAPLIAVTDHAAERFRQRVGATGALDVKPEVVRRVADAWAAGRVFDEPPEGASGARGSLYVRDRRDRRVVYVCRTDRTGREVVVVTLWELEGGAGGPRVPRRFTDALKADDEAVAERSERAAQRRRDLSP